MIIFMYVILYQNLNQYDEYILHTIHVMITKLNKILFVYIIKKENKLFTSHVVRIDLISEC